VTGCNPPDERLHERRNSARTDAYGGKQVNGTSAFLAREYPFL
jgi:hypothetical protein